MGWSETVKKKTNKKTGLTLLNSDFTVASTNLIPQALLIIIFKQRYKLAVLNQIANPPI